MTRPFHATVYRFALGECTLNGMSARYDSLDVFPFDTTREEIDAYYEDIKKRTGKEDVTPLKMRAGILTRNGRFHPIVVPAYKEIYEDIKKREYPDEYKNGGPWMFGGNYCMGDSSWEEHTGCDFPLGIHDRHESWELYDLMFD